MNSARKYSPVASEGGGSSKKTRLHRASIFNVGGAPSHQPPEQHLDGAADSAVFVSSSLLLHPLLPFHMHGSLREFSHASILQA